MPIDGLKPPKLLPERPFFSSGPCVKYPSFDVTALEKALLGRSHRCALGQKRIMQVIRQTQKILALPAHYHLAIIPGSDTGAMEAALWSLLGCRGVDILAFEAFGQLWAHDVADQLGVRDIRVVASAYGELPEYRQLDFNRDVVFVYNGTTSGVCLPALDFIPQQREGLSFCDASSAAFILNLDWKRLDVVTFSWQKALGGEGGFGMIALSPRALQRLKDWTPPWPVPKLLNLKQQGKAVEALFSGQVINTPSFLCIEDCLCALRWIEEIGGVAELFCRVERNFAALDSFVAQCSWLKYAVQKPEHRSKISVCLQLCEVFFTQLSLLEQQEFLQQFVQFLEERGAAYDIHSYAKAPLGLRIWCGPTVETEDIRRLTHWLEYAYTYHKNLWQERG